MVILKQDFTDVHLHFSILTDKIFRKLELLEISLWRTVNLDTSKILNVRIYRREILRSVRRAYELIALFQTLYLKLHFPRV